MAIAHTDLHVFFSFSRLLLLVRTSIISLLFHTAPLHHHRFHILESCCSCSLCFLSIIIVVASILVFIFIYINNNKKNFGSFSCSHPKNFFIHIFGIRLVSMKKVCKMNSSKTICCHRRDIH